MDFKKNIKIYYHTGVFQQSGSFEQGNYKETFVDEVATDIITIDQSTDDFVKELRANNDWYRLQHENSDDGQPHHAYVKVFQVDFLGFVD